MTGSVVGSRIASASQLLTKTNPVPSIAEIIAAKKATASAAPVATVTPPRGTQGTLGERLEAEAAINRIDPPGKQERAAAARKASGLILNNGPLPPAETAIKEAHAAKRMEVPQEITQPADDLPMCVWLDAGTVWLCMPCAVATMPPIKILRLPWTLWPAPPAPQPLPAGDPF